MLHLFIIFNDDVLEQIEQILHVFKETFVLARRDSLVLLLVFVIGQLDLRQQLIGAVDAVPVEAEKSWLLTLLNAELDGADDRLVHLVFFIFVAFQ